MNVGDTLHGYTLIERIDRHGSQREFFRCTKEGRTFVMVRDDDIEQYIRLHEHLLRRGIAVPLLYWFSIEERLMVQEDLGRDSLYELTAAKGYDRATYRVVIDELVNLQVDGWHEAPTTLQYDREHIRWEQEYFIDCFLLQYCGLDAGEINRIKSDLDRLASSIVEGSQRIMGYLMHRDFQSQNIYIKEGRARIIDFQSARIGPLTYDLAALLRDAYVHIDRVAENDLFAYYHEAIERRGIGISGRELRNIYGLTALQRNMQALAAFANLSLNKNRPHFAQYIPRGLELLTAGLQETELPDLKRVVSSINR
ncbi:phosphotransferase [candidate division WOR-3 bacterium]|nr:phosphotransferase [candidate division WOR-3 bacterium]